VHTKPATGPLQVSICDDRSGDRIGDAEVAPEILQHVAHRIQKASHLGPRRCGAVHVVPFTDDTEGPVPGPDQRGFPALPGSVRNRTTLQAVIAFLRSMVRIIYSVDRP
jgi:hypothetical protein